MPKPQKPNKPDTKDQDKKSSPTKEAKGDSNSNPVSDKKKGKSKKSANKNVPTPLRTLGKTKAGGKKKAKKPEPLKDFVAILLTFFILSMLWNLFSGENQPEDISISVLAEDIRAGEVESIEVEGNTATITYVDETVREARKEEGTAISDTLVNYGVDLSAENFPEIEINAPSGFAVWAPYVLQILFPLLLIGFLVWIFFRNMKGSSMQAFSFGQSKARMVDPNNKAQRVLFKDVAGNVEAKQELVEIVDFLKNPKKFIDIGATIPKGVILMGPPGTGKTLLARAVAGEARVPFFSISGSEFVEMFVGVGASRVRDLFKMAKKSAPAIIFVDEIDAVGRTRGSGVGGGNDEREQTLNQILVEMDGFEPNEKVIIMAATNRPDVLDSALLRPGRFDRRVALTLPDRSERLEILKVHARKKPLVDEVDLSVVAARTPGFAGADLQSLMNEAAILAARNDRKKIEQYDIVSSIEKVMLGPERKARFLTDKEREITAFHEAGHALVASVLPNADPVHKISIISRGRAAGYVLRLPLEERRMQTRAQFIDTLAVSLGGYVVEQKIFNDLSTGPSNDLQVATGLARDMVTRYGMSEKIGPIALADEGGNPMHGHVNDKDYSQEVAAIIDEEVASLMKEAYRRAADVVKTHRSVLESIAQKLMEVEVMEQEQFEDLLREHGIQPKQKPEEKK